MFKKILIANRGEIAVRIARTAQAKGIKTVAVFSDADRGAPHVKACDEAIHIGPAPAAESYLIIEKIITAAQQTGAEAVHPGYGFLSENAAFADALEAAGIAFIGPTAETICAMGSKSAAKDLMEAAGVPTTPGYQGEDQSVATFKTEAKRIGYPVLLKATAGGGGKGMRRVDEEKDLEAALKSAQREAKSAFGDDRFLIEKYIETARHLEVQIFGDGKGGVVHLFERDCSVQRRHQKVIEEAPAPDLPAKTRKALLKAGVDAGKAVKYRGAGTVEFLYDGKGGVYFMEMNTRLQVEHPVTEMITGIDLVDWQLRVAAGEPLPAQQSEITETGHAFEARLYAEDPAADFAPSIGRLTTLNLPNSARIDSGVEQGQDITPYYDPMIAKIITHGDTRTLALARLSSALEQTRVAGLETNASFLHALAVDDDFAAGKVSTAYIEQHRDTLFAARTRNDKVIAVAILHALSARAPTSSDPWASVQGLRLNQQPEHLIWLDFGNGPLLAKCAETASGYSVELTSQTTAAERRTGEAKEDLRTFRFIGSKSGPDAYRIELDGARSAATAVAHGAGIRIFLSAQTHDVIFPNPLLGAETGRASDGSLLAPMPGIITGLIAKPGGQITAGDPLLVMEAMKMEHTIQSPRDGVLSGFRFQVGDQVKDGDLLVDFEDDA